MSKMELIELYRSHYWRRNIPREFRTEKVFICPCCGEQKALWDLDIWAKDTDDDIMNDKVICSVCYFWIIDSGERY